MTEIKIVQDEEKLEKKVEVEDIKETLSKADEYQKLKEQNDKLEAEYLRAMELKAKITMGGRAEAGTPEITQEDKDKEEASKILSMFQ